MCQSRRQGHDGAGDRTHPHQCQRWQDDIAFRDMARKQDNSESVVVDQEKLKIENGKLKNYELGLLTVDC